LNELLEREVFDQFCEERCGRFYHEKLGRPSLAPSSPCLKAGTGVGGQGFMECGLESGRTDR